MEIVGFTPLIIYTTTQHVETHQIEETSDQFTNMLPTVFRQRVEEGEINLHNPREESTHSLEGAADSSNNDGTWGERDVGGPVNFHAAMQEYEGMRRELTSLSQSKSRQSRRSNRSGAQRSGLRKILTGGGSNQGKLRQAEADPSIDAHEVESQPEEYIDGEKDEADNEEIGEFHLTEFLKDGHFEKRVEGASAKKVGVVFKHLTGLFPFPFFMPRHPR